MKGALEATVQALLRRLLGRWSGSPPDFNKVLIVLLGGIGDSLLATPAILSFRRRYPAARIVLLINARAAELFEGWAEVDAVVPFEIESFRGSLWKWLRPGTLRHLMQTRRRLRSERFDLAVNLMQIASLRGALQMGLGLKAFGARFRAGRDTDGRAAAFHLRVPESWPGGEHSVEKNLAVAEALGCEAESGPMVIPLTQRDREAAARFLGAHGLKDRPLVTIHPWVAEATRLWPLESWHEVAEALSQRRGATIVVVGGGEDVQAAEILTQTLPGSVFSACGALSLKETAALIERSDLFMGVLSGPLHMAAAVGTPTVACCPKELSRPYAPYTDPVRYRILSPQYSGAPLSEVTPSALTAAAEELLAKEHTPPPREVLSWHRSRKAEPSPSRWSVAHIITRLDRGGSSDNTLLTVLGLDRARYRTTLIAGLTTNPSPMVRRLMDRPDVEVRFVPGLLRAMKPLSDVGALWALYRLCRREKFDLVHTHSSKAGILGRWAAWLAGCRAIVHTPHGHVFTGYYGRWLSRLFAYAERVTGRITDVIITLTPKGIDDHLAWRIAPREKFRAVPSGLELETLSPRNSEGVLAAREALGLPREGRIVGSVGRLDEVKGYDQLIEASALVLRKKADVWFAVAGDGEEREDLLEQARHLGVAHRWRFLGWQEDLNAVYHSFDLSVLPSRNEGMGRTAVEAMACGLAVVATEVGGLPSVVEDGVSGLLVPPEDPRALAEAILRLIGDEALRLRMGACGLSRAREDFSTEAMMAGIESIYSRLLEPPE